MDDRDAASAAHADVEESVLSFDALFVRYHRPIYAFLLGMVGDAARARDLTQDTFLAAHQALARTPDPILPAWLYRIATTTALDALGRRRHRLTWLPFTASDADRWTAIAPDLPPCCAEQEAVQAVLAQLLPRERAALLLRARAGLALTEIAAALDTSDTHAKVLLFRAKERFRRIYGDRGPHLRR